MNAERRPRIDYSCRDYASLRAAMLELARERLPEWSDQSPNDLGVVLVELFAYMGDTLHYYLDRIANESYLDTAVEPRSVVHLLRLIGYELRPPRPASADLTLVFEPAAEPLILKSDTIFETDAALAGDKIQFRYVRDPLDVDVASLPTDGAGSRVLEHLPVVQVDAFLDDEIIGSSDGTAGQRFVLTRGPMIDGSLELRVDEGPGPVVWQQVPSLLRSLSADRHYVVRRDGFGVAWVELGDGKFGRIPGAGRNNLRADFRLGGGDKGNVPARSIVKAVEQISGLERLVNPRPATGGAEQESLAEAVLRGPRLFRARGRAVTGRDYEVHTREFGVGKVRARAASWNRVELFVAPAGGGLPTDTLKEDLRRYFEDKRMIGTVVEIRDPSYVSIRLEGTLEIEPYFFTEQVQQQVKEAVRGFFAFDRVDFEQTLYLSKIYEEAEAVEGVKGVHVTRFARPEATARELPEDGKLVLGWNELPMAGPITWHWLQAEASWQWTTDAAGEEDGNGVD